MRLYVEGFSAIEISKTGWVCLWKNLIQAQNMLALYLFIKNKSNLSSKQAQKHSTHNANN